MDSKTKRMMSPSFFPHRYSVIIGKGKDARTALGTQMLRDAINSKLDDYKNCERRLEKAEIVSELLAEVRLRCPSGGAFVKYDGKRWWELSEHDARENITAAFRNRLHGKYTSSSKFKSARRRMQMMIKKTDLCDLSARLSQRKETKKEMAIICSKREITTRKDKEELSMARQARKKKKISSNNSFCNATAPVDETFVGGPSFPLLFSSIERDAVVDMDTEVCSLLFSGNLSSAPTPFRTRWRHADDATAAMVSSECEEEDEDVTNRLTQQDQKDVSNSTATFWKEENLMIRRSVPRSPSSTSGPASTNMSGDYDDHLHSFPVLSSSTIRSGAVGAKRSSSTAMVGRHEEQNAYDSNSNPGRETSYHQLLLLLEPFHHQDEGEDELFEPVDPMIFDSPLPGLAATTTSQQQQHHDHRQSDDSTDSLSMMLLGTGRGTDLSSSSCSATTSTVTGPACPAVAGTVMPWLPLSSASMSFKEGNSNKTGFTGVSSAANEG